MFRRPEPLPVKRLVKNLAAAIKKAPKNDQLLYNMGRLHYLALANQSTLVPAFESRSGTPSPAPEHLAENFLWSLRYDEATRRAKDALEIKARTKMDQAMWRKLDKARAAEMKKLEDSGWRPPAPSMDELHQHAEQAMVYFNKAIELAPKKPLYHLGRVSLGEQCLDLELRGKLPRRRVLEPLAKLTYAGVRDQYYDTFKLALGTDIKNGSIPLEGMSGLVSYEAGHAYLRLVKGPKGSKGRKDDEEKPKLPSAKSPEKLRQGQEERIVEVQKGLARLRRLRPGPVTPILIARSSADRLDDLLDPAATVSFDLDGDGVSEDWPWVRPDTGILAWDPLARGEIVSGRQLFGSVTFFLFHQDGYAALRLLDDNQDGELSGLELDGLAIWKDANGDGCSTAAEVQPVWQAGVTAIRTTASHTTASHGRGRKRVLHNRVGLCYRDGRVVPTYDWVTRRR
jgi:hypothetical protein